MGDELENLGVGARQVKLAMLTGKHIPEKSC